MRPVTQSLTVLLPFPEASFRHNPLAMAYRITLIALLLLYHPSCEEMTTAVNLSVVHLHCQPPLNGELMEFLPAAAVCIEKKRNHLCGALKVMTEIQKESQAQVLYPTPCRGRGNWMSTLSLIGDCAGWNMSLLSANCPSARKAQ